MVPRGYALPVSSVLHRLGAVCIFHSTDSSPPTLTLIPQPHPPVQIQNQILYSPRVTLSFLRDAYGKSRFSYQMCVCFVARKRKPMRQNSICCRWSDGTILPSADVTVGSVRRITVVCAKVQSHQVIERKSNDKIQKLAQMCMCGMNTLL